MKTLLITLLLLTMTSQAMNAFEPPRMHPTDRFIVTLFTDIWQDTPDQMELKTIQRGISINALQDMPLWRTNFSIAAGLGFTSHNLYSDHFYLFNTYENRFDFYPIPYSYEKNKISLNYMEVPVQLRYRTRDLNRTFRIYAGMKAGYLVNAHTKYVGKMTFSGPGGIQFLNDDEAGETTTMERTTKIKTHKLRNINNLRVGLSAMVGYRSVNLYIYYPITNIFDDNHAEDMRPITLGFSFILF